MIKVILKEEVQGLGYDGDLVEVKSGYARNYLLPQGLALAATEENLALWEEQREELQAKRAEAEQVALGLKDLIDETVVTIVTKAGEEGKLFGSVTSQDIADAFQEETSQELDRKKIELQENLKELGEHRVLVKVFPEVNAELRVRVENEAGQISVEEDETEEVKEEPVSQEEVQVEDQEETTEETEE